MFRETILKLRSEGKSYRQIQRELNCSSSTVAYHLGKGQKEKIITRVKTNVTNRRKAVKHASVSAFGGACCSCQYNLCESALEFHHIDKSNKEFSLSKAKDSGYPISKVKSELKKCIMVCSNCHKEIHSKIKNDPLGPKFNEEIFDLTFYNSYLIKLSPQ